MNSQVSTLTKSWAPTFLDWILQGFEGCHLGSQLTFPPLQTLDEWDALKPRTSSDVAPPPRHPTHGPWSSLHIAGLTECICPRPPPDQGKQRKTKKNKTNKGMASIGHCLHEAHSPATRQQASRQREMRTGRQKNRAAHFTWDAHHELAVPHQGPREGAEQRHRRRRRRRGNITKSRKRAGPLGG